MSTLRVFESSARLLSFDKAGVELNVSASAVSQQIARLEGKLGLVLFERLHRRIALTDAGRALSRPLTSAFKTIDRALAVAYQSANKESVKLAIYQTWASRWLIPRLGEFSRAWPQLSVEFEAGMDDIDLEHSDVDFAVRWCSVDGVSAGAYKLFDEILVAVCSPSMAASLQHVAELDAVSLIHSANRPDDWATWLAASGHAGIHGSGRLKFSNTSLAIGAAVAGAGMLVGQVHLFLPEIESGALAMPFGLDVRTARGLYLLEAPSNEPKTSTTAFREWLLLEAGLSAARATSLCGCGSRPGEEKNVTHRQQAVLSGDSVNSIFR